MAKKSVTRSMKRMQEAQEAADKDLEANPYTPVKVTGGAAPRLCAHWKEEEIQAKLVRPGEDPEKLGRTSVVVSLPLLEELAHRCHIKMPKSRHTIGKFLRGILKVQLVGLETDNPTKD